MRNYITFKKLILLFLVAILPLFLLSLFLIYQNSVTMKKRIFFSIQDKTNLTAQTLTDSFEQIYYTATEVASQSNLNKIATIDSLTTSYDTAKSLLELREQQTSIKNANPYIDNFVIYYKKRQQAYNSESSGLASFFDFTKDEYQKLAETRTSSDFLILYNERLSEIILPSSSPDFLIRVDLSPKTITSLLSNAFTEYETYYLLESFDRSYTLTNFTQEQLGQLPNTGFSDQLTLNKQRYHCFSTSIPYGNTQIHFFFSDDQLFAETKIYQYLTLYFALFILITCCIFLLGSYAIIHKPIKTLSNAFQNINNQNYSVRIFSNKNSDFAYLYNEFNHMAKQLGTLIEKDYQQQLLLNKAELKQLQAQINPHFLYNSLFLLRRMLQDELYEEAYHMSDILGLYFQYITRNNQDYMPLSQEYRHAILYCEIQKLRFEGRIHVETASLPTEYSNILVPKLIIQPILENAFNYGLQNRMTDGLLKITISATDSELTICIEDNGEDRSDDNLRILQNKLQNAIKGNQLQEMTGILNIQRRLSIYSDQKSYLTASRSSLGGLCIQLIISTL